MRAEKFEVFIQICQSSVFRVLRSKVYYLPVQAYKYITSKQNYEWTKWIQWSVRLRAYFRQIWKYKNPERVSFGEAFVSKAFAQEYNETSQNTCEHNQNLNIFKKCFCNLRNSQNIRTWSTTQNRLKPAIQFRFITPRRGGNNEKAKVKAKSVGRFSSLFATFLVEVARLLSV